MATNMTLSVSTGTIDIPISQSVVTPKPVTYNGNSYYQCLIGYPTTCGVNPQTPPSYDYGYYLVNDADNQQTPDYSPVGNVLPSGVVTITVGETSCPIVINMSSQGGSGGYANQQEISNVKDGNGTAGAGGYNSLVTLTLLPNATYTINCYVFSDAINGQNGQATITAGTASFIQITSTASESTPLVIACPCTCTTASNGDIEVLNISNPGAGESSPLWYICGGNGSAGGAWGKTSIVLQIQDYTITSSECSNLLDFSGTNTISYNTTGISEFSVVGGATYPKGGDGITITNPCFQLAPGITTCVSPGGGCLDIDNIQSNTPGGYGALSMFQAGSDSIFTYGSGMGGYGGSVNGTITSTNLGCDGGSPTLNYVFGGGGGGGACNESYENLYGNGGSPSSSYICIYTQIS